MKALKTIWNWLSGILVAIVVLLAVALVGVRLIGLHPFVVCPEAWSPNTM